MGRPVETHHTGVNLLLCQRPLESGGAKIEVGLTNIPKISDVWERT